MELPSGNSEPYGQPARSSAAWHPCRGPFQAGPTYSGAEDGAEAGGVEGRPEAGGAESAGGVEGGSEAGWGSAAAGRSVVGAEGAAAKLACDGVSARKLR